MLARELKQVEQIWPAIREAVFYPHTEAEYNWLVTVLESLIDEVGENESHPLASLMEVIGILVEIYEDEHVPELSQF